MNELNLPLENIVITLIESEQEFPVNFDDAWQWVGYKRKDTAKEALTKNFISKVDYNIMFSGKKRKTPTSCRPSELIVMTVDCFKSFCMIAGNDKGREVREYFLDCERKLRHLTKQSVPQRAKFPDGLLNLVARIEKRGEELHTKHHQLMADIRQLIEVVRTTYNSSSSKEYLELLTRLNDQLTKVIAVSSSSKLIEDAFIRSSTQTGCLERYTSTRKNKAGQVVVYPRINAAYRDESIDSDWSWRYRYSVKNPDTGKWTARSKSVKLDKLPAIRAAIALNAILPTILRLIEG